MSDIYVNPVPPVAPAQVERQTGIYKRLRKQTAAWWKCVGDDGYGGYVYDPPVTVVCRWQSSYDRRINERGDEVVGKATVFVAVDMEPNDYLKLIENDQDLLDVNNHLGDPKNCPKAYIIDRFVKTPDLRVKNNLRKAFLR